MWPCGGSGGADGANSIAWFEHLAFFDGDFAQMHEDADYALPVIESDDITMHAEPFFS